MEQTPGLDLTQKVTASQAAQILGYSGRTARAVAKKLHAAGDKNVERVGPVWSATLGHWKQALETPDDYGHKPRRRLGE